MFPFAVHAPASGKHVLVLALIDHMAHMLANRNASFVRAELDSGSTHFIFLFLTNERKQVFRNLKPDKLLV